MSEVKQKNAAFWQADAFADSSKVKSHRFTYTAPREACVGPPDRQFFMGGAAMATACDALERAMAKPLLWATTQFLNHGMLGEHFDIEVEAVSGGRRVVQAMAILRRGDRIIQRTLAALGAREGEPDRQFINAPKIASPDNGPRKKDDAFGHASNLIGQFDRRTALEDNDAGLEYMWIRPKFDFVVDVPLLVLVSDFFLGAHKRSRGGTSLDNTFRLCRLAQTDWILCATHIASFTSGAMQGAQYLFAEDGTLLAIASQTGLLPHTPNP